MRKYLRQLPSVLGILLVNLIGVSVLPLLIFGGVMLLTMWGNK